jgi:hypothetical protein
VSERYIAFLVTFLAARRVRRGIKVGAVHVQIVIEFIALPFWGYLAIVAVFAHDVLRQGGERRYLLFLWLLVMRKTKVAQPPPRHVGLTAALS